MSPYSYFNLSSKRSEFICARNEKKTRFCDSDVLKNVLKFQLFSVLKIKIARAQALGSKLESDLMCTGVPAVLKFLKFEIVLKSQ